MQRTKNFYLIAIASIIAGFGLFLLPEYAIAATSKGVGDMSKEISTQLTSVASLIIIVAYVAGICFALAGIIQFKAHKDNPQQVPLSKPIVYLIVGACLLYLPSLIGASGQTIFGGSQKSAGSATGIIE